MHATQKLVTSFLKSRPAAADDAFQRFQKTETEVGHTSDFDGLHLDPQCTALRSEVVIVRKRLEEAEADIRKYHEQLAVSEMRIDRLQSNVVAAIQAKSSPKEDVMEEDQKPIEESNSPDCSGASPASSFST